MKDVFGFIYSFVLEHNLFFDFFVWNVLDMFVLFVGRFLLFPLLFGTFHWGCFFLWEVSLQG